MQPRLLMTGGAIIGAVAAFLFAVSGSTSIFFLSRLLEGIGAAAIVPALLAYITDATEGRSALRVRALSYFELTLLAGLALGGIVAAQLFRLRMRVRLPSLPCSTWPVLRFFSAASPVGRRDIWQVHLKI